MSSQTGQPAAAGGYLSPDGYWWWDGTNWVPVPQPAFPGRPQVAFTPLAPRRPVPWFRILGGSTAVLGVIATLVASIVPYGTFPDPTGGPANTSSIFSGGFSGASWDIAEPVFVMLAGAVAAALVFIGLNRTVQAISGGVLIAVGAQTATMWAAYLGLASTDGSPEAGAVIGIGGSVLLLLGGVLALVGLLAARTAPEAAPTAPGAAATPLVAQEPAAPTPPAEPAPQPASTETPTA